MLLVAQCYRDRSYALASINHPPGMFTPSPDWIRNFTHVCARKKGAHLRRGVVSYQSFSIQRFTENLINRDFMRFKIARRSLTRMDLRSQTQWFSRSAEACY